MIHFRVIRIQILILIHITESSLLLRGIQTLDFSRKTTNTEYHEASGPTLVLIEQSHYLNNFGGPMCCEFMIFRKTT